MSARQSQRAPSQPGSQSQIPQVQLPLPEQSLAQGKAEQLQAGPVHASSHSQMPQLQVPREGPPQTSRFSSTGHTRERSQEQSAPEKGEVQLQTPAQPQVPWPEQSPGQGRSMQEQSGPLNPTGHRHSPHTQGAMSEQLFGQTSEESHSQASPVHGAEQLHSPQSQVPCPEHVQFVSRTSQRPRGHGRSEQEQSFSAGLAV